MRIAKTKRPTCALFIAVLLLHQTWVAVVHAASAVSPFLTESKQTRNFRKKNHNGSLTLQLSAKSNLPSAKSNLPSAKSNLPSPKSQLQSTKFSSPSATSQPLSATSQPLSAKSHDFTESSAHSGTRSKKNLPVQWEPLRRFYAVVLLSRRPECGDFKLDYESQPENGGRAYDFSESLFTIIPAVKKFCVGCNDLMARAGAYLMFVCAAANHREHPGASQDFTKKLIATVVKMSKGDFTMLKAEEIEKVSNVSMEELQPKLERIITLITAAYQHNYQQ